jgi:hypothetical protein
MAEFCEHHDGSCVFLEEVSDYQLNKRQLDPYSRMVGQFRMTNSEHPGKKLLWPVSLHLPGGKPMKETSCLYSRPQKCGQNPERTEEKSERLY